MHRHLSFLKTFMTYNFPQFSCDDTFSYVILYNFYTTVYQCKTRSRSYSFIVLFSSSTFCVQPHDGCT